MGIWEHDGNVENTSRGRVFATFLIVRDVSRFALKGKCHEDFAVLG